MTADRVQGSVPAGNSELRFAFGADATREALGLTWEEFATGLWSELSYRSVMQDRAARALAAARTQTEGQER